MHILLLGNTGQLGWELERSLAPLGEITALDYPQIDLTKIQPLRNLIQQTHPELIINATAYTAVDRAESEPDLAMAINGIAPGVLAEEAFKSHAAFIHYSTDYVFDGTKGSDYLETDIPNPINTYGRTKLNGEQAVQQIGGAYLILRTSWVYSLRRENFLLKVLSWLKTKPVLKMVTDQVGSPTWSRMLAETSALALVMGSQDIVPWIQEQSGIYHLAGQGSCSRYEFAQAVVRYSPEKVEYACKEIQTATSADFPSPAVRPSNTALSCAKFTEHFGINLPPWEKTLRIVLSETL